MMPADFASMIHEVAAKTTSLRILRFWCRESVVVVYMARGTVQHVVTQGYN